MKGKQKQDILNHFVTCGRLTPLEALKLYGCFRLAAVVFVLKKEGHTIITHDKTENGKSFAEYEFVKPHGQMELI